VPLVLVGPTVVTAVVIGMELTEAVGPVVGVMEGIPDTLTLAVFPRQIVDIYDAINAASVGLVCDACKHERHPDPLTKTVGQKQLRFEPHMPAAMAILEHSETQASGFSQVERTAPICDASVVFMATVTKQELHAAPLMRTVGQRQS
jgi:hypothetical protein